MMRHMNDPAIFLTGTGTGVGKTVVGCALASLWAGAGRGPKVFKPAESGCLKMDNGLHPRDAWALKMAAGDGRPLDEICPYRYELPLAPAYAAEKEGGAPNLERIVKTISTLRSRPGPLLVEGAGGLLVPLEPGTRMSDIAARCGLVLLIVAPLGLGALNDTQLTVRAAISEGISVAGIVLNDLTGEDSPAARQNPAAIRVLCDVPLLGIFPYLPGIDAELEQGAAPRLREAAHQVNFSAIG